MAEGSVFDSTNLLLYLWRRKWPIIIITGLAAVGSIVVSLLMDERFKSTVVLYPAYAAQVNFEDNGLARNNVLLFGEEEEAEQMLQILQSGKIRERIIDWYNLWEHYELDSTAQGANTDIKEMYDERVNIKRTKYGSVNIEVTDTEPVIASGIANDIAALYDTVRNEMMMERSYPAFQIMEKEYNETRERIDWLVDTLRSLSQMGVEHPYSASLGEFTRGWATAVIEKPSAIPMFEDKLKVQEQYGPTFKGYTEELEELSTQLIEIEAQYKQKKSDYENFLSSKFTVEHAVPADKKSYPVRWLIVVMSTASAFFFAIVMLVSLDKIRELRKKV